MKVTRIGGPTLLVELEGWRILLDPTFDEPGRTYSFALGTSSTKTRGPLLPLDRLGPIDVVLLSHDHHADNLDDAGRELLPTAGRVLTTASGARRLELPNVTGLKSGQSTRLQDAGKPTIHVTATPCRHGPPLSRPIVGEAIGFALRLEGQETTALWVTGDTVLSKPLRRTAQHLDVDVAVVNAGGVRFGLTGPIRYTMTGAEAVQLITELRPRVAIPAHYDGWSHFRDGENGLRAAVGDAPPSIQDLIRWIPDGAPVEV